MIAAVTCSWQRLFSQEVAMLAAIRDWLFHLVPVPTADRAEADGVPFNIFSACMLFGERRDT
jgi:hypothetical protein